MRNILGAFALAAVMASQAGAATISGETNPIVGQTYTYIYSPDTPSLTPGYTNYALTIFVDDPNDASGDVGFSFEGPTYPESNTFSFDWVFNATGPAVLNVESAIVTFFENGFQFPEGVQFSTKPDGITLFRFQNIEGITLMANVSVVPIGGTLPLLLSALGLIGWAARRRTKQGALPA